MTTEHRVQPGMGKSLFENKYSRRKPNGEFLTWAEHMRQNVVPGNFSLASQHDEAKYVRTEQLAVQGVLPFSGRHLQHGDLAQRSKTGERFTNCSTAMTSFQKFWLLMQGSGVGRLYDADLCRVDWSFMPHARFVLEQSHPDYEPWVEDARDAKHRYDSESETTRWFTVEDSAEGWAKVVEILETAAFQRRHKDKLFVFDFSGVRAKGAPIAGQQGRPASGPIPFIRSLVEVSRIRDAGMKPWRQAMHIDHHLSECILLGGIRRSARIACKSWRERDVMEFIDIKRGGFLWSANNSVVVDDEFWEKASSPAPSHARRVFDAMCSAAYYDGTGEPGFLNAAKMDWQRLPHPSEYDITEGHFQKKYHPRTAEMLRKLYEVAYAKEQQFIVNPCGEIVLSAAGGYCVIADICLSKAQTDEDLLDAAALSAEFLMRVNTMPFMYEAEVQRTNRIGIGLTGVFEYAWNRFGYTFFDLIDEERSRPFWAVLADMRERAKQAAERFANKHYASVPHTMFTMKPSGTISKTLGVTEAAHLPAMAYYLRWVQFREDDPEYRALREKGYPWKDVSSMYKGTHVLGYPTQMAIAADMGQHVVTMDDVTMDQQYKWLELLEKHWIGSDGKGNQISYTMKYDPARVDFESYKRLILEHQPKVRACSMMPQIDTSAYVYVPEQRISHEEYVQLMAGITDAVDKENYDDSALVCEGGACPIEFDRN